MKPSWGALYNPKIGLQKKRPLGLWVHAGCCKPAVWGSFAWLPGRCQVTCTHSAPPERALLRTKGFYASGEATARDVNLYADMIAAG